MNAHRDAIAALVHEALGARIVVARDDGSARDFEGLPRFAGIVAGEGPTRVEYRLGPNRLEADLLTDSKTGGFLDQADNHAAVAALAPDNARALDAFTYHGGFALALARRGGPVLATGRGRRRRGARHGQRAPQRPRQPRGAPRQRLRSAARPRGAARAVRRRRARPARARQARRHERRVGAQRRRPRLQGASSPARRAPHAARAACSSCARARAASTRAHWDELVAEGLADAGRPAQVLARATAPPPITPSFVSASPRRGTSRPGSCACS